MATLLVFPRSKRIRLPELVIAYVNEPSPVSGQQGLRSQIRAVTRRSHRDGLSIGLLVIESGGGLSAHGRGHRLEKLIQAGRDEPATRILYVADTKYLGSGTRAVLGAIEDLVAVDFTLRAPCGHIALTGRRVAGIRRAIEKEDRSLAASRLRHRASLQSWIGAAAPAPTRRYDRSFVDTSM